MLFAKKHTLKISNIKIRDSFTESPPGSEKLIYKTADYIQNKHISPILVNNEGYLIDGYCSYLIRKTLGEIKVRVTVVKEKGC